MSTGALVDITTTTKLIFKMKDKISIIIPTYNHFHDAFKPCIDAVLKYTNLIDKEIIVVANGCTDETKSYLESLGNQLSYIWFDDPMGYIKSVNAGIEKSTGEYIVLLDNDSILLPQWPDEWINILKAPFLKNEKVGASSPFAHEYENMGLVLHSGCTMYRASVLKQIGMFDVVYHPGYFSDSDVAMKIWNAGYECVEVPTRNDNKPYNNNVFAINFPVMHLGNVQTMDKNKDSAIVAKNREILYSRYGKNMSNVDKWNYNNFNTPVSYGDTTTYKLGAEFLKNCTTVEDWGCGTAFFSTVLDSEVKYIGVDGSQSKFNSLHTDLVKYTSSVDGIFMRHVLEHNHNWEPILKNALASFKSRMVLVLFTPTSDSTHVIANNANGVPDIAFNLADIETHLKPFRYRMEVVKTDTQYGIETIFYIERGVKYSVVIPTYNHCDDLLKPCLESIEQYSDMTQIEVIVSANGCTDNTREYVESLDPKIYKLVWSDEALGYTKATNLGIKAAVGEYVVLLNNDTLILPSEKNTWLNMLEQPFIERDNVGLTGPLELFDDYANSPALIFFCVMVKRELFDKIGLLDEIFTPGGGEDIDFSVRAKLAGYDAVQVVTSEYNGVTNVGNFPIWHKDNKTFGDIPEYGNYIVKRNGLINAKRFNKSIKLNLGSGGVPYKGWLSVDLYDKRAHIKMDITKLDFDDCSVEEILASHVFEHLNPYHALDILRDWLRVLKPGGKLTMEMPDIEATCAAFNTASTGERYGLLNVIYGSVNTTGEGGDDNITAPHLFGWWKQSLWDHLTNAGFVDIEFMDEQIPHPGHNLRVEAIKPLPNRAALQAHDPMTYLEVFSQNGYSLTSTGPLSVRGKTVIDIGANVGMFSLRCLELGANRVIAVEAQPNVFNNGLLNNVRDYPKITPINRACLDVDGQSVLISNQNVHSVIGESGDLVTSISLKTIVDQYAVEPDSYLKIDCEGSEYDILMNVDIDTLRKFKVIDMELHMQANSNIQYRGYGPILSKLDQMGFKMEKYTPHYMMFGDGRMFPIDVCVMKWVRID